MTSDASMTTGYQPDIIETDTYEQWEKSGYFIPDMRKKYQHTPYCIMLPPPNVTGSLHMGHGFQHTLMDTLIRYHRMRGCNTLWQGGTDHAGIATQLVVERQLEKENLTRESLGREKFQEKVWAWKNVSGGEISRQMRKMGSSIDWSSERFTMDEGFSVAVQKAFAQLYHDGLIYRGKRLVNWDIQLQSAVSDLEVIFTEETGQLYYLKYYLKNPLSSLPDSIPDYITNYMTVATTRPETLFGDAAVAVHPEDSRYQHLIGRELHLPLTNKTIFIIADASVDPQFGTGCVKITPAHDFNDYLIGQRHQLAMINILNKNGTLNHLTPFENLDRLAARKKMITELQDKNLIEKIEPHTAKIPRCERTGEIIEPFLTEQWYVKMQPLAKRAIEAVEKGEIKFIPENWTKTYLQWLDNIQDWCISRQSWWGHRIPVFYDSADNIVHVGPKTAIKTSFTDDLNQDLTQDNDVLDTWFSSALWPFATLGWPENTEKLNVFYPTNVLVTGFDIIFFWVARMIMFSLYFTDKIPFREVYITGLIRDQHGHKMSKSKGNVLDPIDLTQGINLNDLIQKRTKGLINPKMAEKIRSETQKEFPQGISAYGTDALRFTFCALANTGRDIRFDLARVAGYRNFCNKLWNASRFLLINKIKIAHISTHSDLDLSYQDISSPDIFSQAIFNQAIFNQAIFKQWILSRLQKVIQQVHDYFKQYRFDLITQVLHDFVWHDFCDWYVELAKTHLNQSTQETLFVVLNAILKLLHPIMPYITEAIWQKINVNQNPISIQLEPYPEYQAALICETSEKKVLWLQQIITAIRNMRSEMKISPAKCVTVLFYKGNATDKKNMTAFIPAIQTLTRLEKLKETDHAVSNASTAVIGELQLFLPLDGLVDLAAEKIRLNKEIAKLTLDLEKSQHKLNNADYVNKAPEKVVAQERERVKNFQIMLEKLQNQAATMADNK